ncbi:MAG: ABC transporter ATP-binding protein [Caulobacteraceae bacterium]
MSFPLELRGLAVARGGRTVLEDIALTVEPGEVAGLVGANGSGKTTLIRAALGLSKAKRGEARLFGRPVRGLGAEERASLVAYLPQERRVGWNLPAWRIAALGAPRLSANRARGAALEALSRVGVSPLAERGILDMSGGERARVLIARLLAASSPLILADEPTAGLDPDAQLLVMEILREEARRGAAVVASLHDLALGARACDRLVVLKQGRILAAAAPAQALSRQTLREGFGLEGSLIETAAGPVLAARRAGEETELRSRLRVAPNE